MALAAEWRQRAEVLVGNDGWPQDQHAEFLRHWRDPDREALRDMTSAVATNTAELREIRSQRTRDQALYDRVAAVLERLAIAEEAKVEIARSESAERILIEKEKSAARAAMWGKGGGIVAIVTVVVGAAGAAFKWLYTLLSQTGGGHTP